MRKKFFRTLKKSKITCCISISSSYDKVNLLAFSIVNPICGTFCWQLNLICGITICWQLDLGHVEVIMVAAKSSKIKSKVRIFGNELKLARGPNKSDPISIIERYRKECGSLKIGEIERLRNSIMTSSVIAESHQQNKNEEHLKYKRSFSQTDLITVGLECFFRKALTMSEFAIMLESMVTFLQTPPTERISNSIPFQVMLPEHLKAHLQYNTNPTSEVII